MYTKIIGEVEKNTTTKHLNQNKMTAVEWLVDQMRQRKEQGLTLSFYDLEMFASYAKAMEKERIIKTYEVGISRGINYDEDVYHKNNWRSGEKYYNETFKSE